MGAGAGCGCGVAGLVEDVSRLATAGCGPDSSPGARGRTLIEGLDKVRGRLRADPQLRVEIGAELG